MKKRIFIALSLSDRLQREILEWEKNWTFLPVRWLAGKNLHITLLPPWWVEEKEIEKVKSVLSGFDGAVAGFEFCLTKVTFGPTASQPRLIWAEGQTPVGLIGLRNSLIEALGQKSEERPFLLHLTLARFRPQDFRRLAIKVLAEKVNWREEVKDFVLMESCLLPSGADYKILLRVKLNA